MTVGKAMEKIQEMEEHSLRMKKKAFEGVTSHSMSDEIIITYGDLVDMLADREELIAIYKRMKVDYR